MAKVIPWGRDSIVALIELVREFPCIWDYKSPDFRKKMMKTDSFKHISDALKAEFTELKDLNAELVKNKFNHLRTYYQRESKKIQSMQSGSAGQINSKWEYFDCCSYMQETGTLYRGKSNLKLTSKTNEMCNTGSGTIENEEPSTSAIVTTIVESYSQIPEAIEGVLLDDVDNEEISHSSSNSSPPPLPLLPSATPSRKKEDRKRKRKTSLGAAVVKLQDLIEKEQEIQRKKLLKEDKGEVIRHMFNELCGQICCPATKNKFVKATMQFLLDFITDIGQTRFEDQSSSEQRVNCVQHAERLRKESCTPVKSCELKNKQLGIEPPLGNLEPKEEITDLIEIKVEEEDLCTSLDDEVSNTPTIDPLEVISSTCFSGTDQLKVDCSDSKSISERKKMKMDHQMASHKQTSEVVEDPPQHTQTAKMVGQLLATLSPTAQLQMTAEVMQFIVERLPRYKET